MDLSKFLSGPGDDVDCTAGGTEAPEEEENAGVKEGQWRDRLYKRKGINFTTTTRENRTLRSLNVHERRKSSRQSQQIAGRGIVDAEDLDLLDENDENVDTENNRNTGVKNKHEKTKKVDVAKEPTNSKSRRDKLSEYLEQKKKLDDQKRKMAKPAFKVGVIHHPVAPIGAGFHKPNIFSTNLNRSRSTAQSTPKVVPRQSKSKPIRQVTTTAAVTGRVTRSKAANVKVVAADSKAKLKQEVTTKKQKSFKVIDKKVGASFAPDNFEFKLNIPLQSVVEEAAESINMQETGPKSSTPVSKTVQKEKSPKSSKKVKTPKLIQKKVTPPKSKTVSPEVKEQAEKSPSLETKKTEEPEQTPMPVTPELSQPRGRRRSRRISGVQPDPSLTVEDLCVTPAKRAKERSVSRDRRQSQCGMCPGEHTCATPRATPRVSRMSKLPALSEADTSVTDGQEEETDVSMRRSIRAFEVPLPVTEKKRTSRRSQLQPMEVSEPNTDANVITPDKLSNLARIAVDIPLPTTEKKGRSRRSLKIQPMEVETIAEEKSVVQDTPVTNLSKSMDRASIESATKEPTFKTPMKISKLAGIKSATKPSISPLLAAAPWISTSRGSSKRKRKESPASNLVSDLFENLEGSPLLYNLEKKVMSNENISEADFDEIPTAKQMKLDKDFEEIAVEEKKENNDIIEAASGEKEHDIPYFRTLLVTETARISSVCDAWEKKFEENVESMSDDVQGEVRSVIGQGRLVMAQRFSQFSGLVDNCEYKRGEKETTCTDLMGFWEMIYFQVEDVDKKFGRLHKIEMNNWTEVVVKPVANKKKIIKNPAVVTGAKKAASSGLKALIAAKRKAAEDAKAASKIVENVQIVEESEKKVETITAPEEPASKRLNIKEMIARKRAQLAKEKAVKEATAPLDIHEVKDEESHVVEHERTFEGGFFSVKSPVRSNPSSIESSPKPLSSIEKSRRSMVGDKLRRAVLTESARRVSGLVSPFVSQVARRSLQGSEISPFRAIQPTNLYDDIEVTDNVESKETEADSNSLVEMFDPIAPLSSPVTKTYSKSGSSPAAKQRQIDAFDQMVVGSSPKVDSCYFEPSTPMVNFTDNVELISFDSPEDTVSALIPNTPATKSKIPVKTPARRSTRGTPKKV